MKYEKKAAFIKWGDFSHTNSSVSEILKLNFPDFRIDVIDISTLISLKDALVVFHCLKEYKKDILFGRKTISGSFLRTSYAFDKLKQAIENKLINHNYAFTFQTQSVFDASIPGVPHFLYTDHTHLANLKNPLFDRQKLFSNSWIECEKKVYQNATLNFTMSANISKSIIEDYSCNPDKVLCVYCGANVQVTQNEILNDERFSNKNILFVGVEWANKGGLELEKAFKVVLDIYPKATLTVVGCKPKLNLPNCNVVGKVPLLEVKKYYEQASVFCLPTRFEAFGIVFLEAMAHKLPIIGSNIGAIPNFIVEGENGYLIDLDDTQQLADKLIELIGSPEKCKTFGEYGHRIFWDRYTWEKTGARICENIKMHLVN